MLRSIAKMSNLARQDYSMMFTGLRLYRRKKTRHILYYILDLYMLMHVQCDDVSIIDLNSQLYIHFCNGMSTKYSL